MCPPSPGLSAVDHLVLACPTLDGGLDHVERLLGTRPAPGGRHPAFGTHNALVSLGPATYLEVIAPDPTLPRPAGGLAFGLEELSSPRLTTWVLRREDIEAAAATPDAGLGPVLPGERRTPDGRLLRWRLTDPAAMPLDGAVPFLIAWGDTPHPAASAPRAGTLVALRVRHPDPDRVRAVLGALGAPLPVEVGDEAGLVAEVDTPKGVIELR